MNRLSIRLPQNDADTAWLTSLVSLTATQNGRGIGTALLKAVEGAARVAGCSGVWLTISNDNLEALRFYQRQGYPLVARSVRWRGR